MSLQRSILGNIYPLNFAHNFFPKNSNGRHRHLRNYFQFPNLIYNFTEILTNRAIVFKRYI